MNASEIFDEALIKEFAAKKGKFLRETENLFSGETQDSLDRKTQLVKQMMSEGRSFRSACDDPDVFIGSLDAEYVSYRLDLGGFLDSPITLERWRSNYLYLMAKREIERVIL